MAGHVDLQLAPPAPDQVVAHVGHARIESRRFRRLAGALDGAQRDAHLRLTARFG